MAVTTGWPHNAIGLAALEAMEEVERGMGMAGAAVVTIETDVTDSQIDGIRSRRRWRMSFNSGEWQRTERTEVET